MESNQYRARMWKELQRAEQRQDLSDAQARRYQLLAEQIGYPWYGRRVALVVK